MSSPPHGPSAKSDAPTGPTRFRLAHGLQQKAREETSPRSNPAPGAEPRNQNKKEDDDAAAVLKSATETQVIAATVEDEATISVDALEYKTFAADHIAPYLVAIVNRKGRRYNFGGICDNKAFFNA